MVQGGACKPQFRQIKRSNRSSQRSRSADIHAGQGFQRNKKTGFKQENA